MDLDRRRPPMTTTTAMDAALLLDPPHIKRDQRIPPIKDWPGRPTNFHKRRWWPWPRAAREPAPPGPPEDAASRPGALGPPGQLREPIEGLQVDFATARESASPRPGHIVSDGGRLRTLRQKCAERCLDQFG